MAVYGYARVSTREQHTEQQEARLKAAGAEKVFRDKVSGTKASRPEWDQCLTQLRKDDTLLVVKLDRIGRSLINLVDVVNELGLRGVNIRCLDQGEIDTTTASGKLLFRIMAVIADWEREIIAERTVEGLKAAKARHGGKLPTRGSSYTPDQVALAKRLYAEREQSGMSVKRIAELVGCSRQYVYELVRMD